MLAWLVDFGISEAVLADWRQRRAVTLHGIEIGM